MAYISPIAVEIALRSIDEMAPEAIRHNQATEAAHVLLATSRSRVAGGLDAALTEHWARLVRWRSRGSLSPGDGARDLAPTINRLDVADADLQVAFAVLAAAYEG
jgi:hypothetical protein